MVRKNTMACVCSALSMALALVAPSAAEGATQYTLTTLYYCKDGSPVYENPSFVAGKRGQFSAGTSSGYSCAENIPEGYYASGWRLDTGYGSSAIQSWGVANAITIVFDSGWASKYGTQLNLAVSIDQKTYSVEYNANGGSWSGSEPQGFDDAKYWEAGHVAASATKATRTGWSPTGWNTEPDGSGRSVASGGTLDGSALGVKDNGETITLYAQWTKRQYDLTLVKGEGIASIYYKVNGASTYTAVSQDAVVKVDYNTTWYAYAEAAEHYTHTETSFANPKYGTMREEGATFAPKAVANTYSVNTQASPPAGGTITKDPFKEKFSYGESVTLVAYPEEGYDFDHWTVGGKSAGTGSSCTITVSQDTYCTAYFAKQASQYAISVVVDPAKGGTPSGAGTYRSGETATLDVAPATGYSFQRWSDGNTSLPRTVVVTSADTYVAQMAPGQYVLHLDPQEGFLPEERESKDITYDAPYGDLPEPTSASVEREFQGWFTETTGGAQVLATDIVTNTAPVQWLYAQWTDKDMCALVYAPGDYGMGDIVSNRYERGTHVVVSNALYVREGYVQAAWSRDVAGASKAAEFGGDLTLDKDETFYPCWSNIAYAVAFDGNGGTGAMASLAARYDEPLALPANGFSRTRHTFLGWTTRADGPAVYAAGEVVSNLTSIADETVTLYAVWQANEDPATWCYRIHFAPNAEVLDPTVMTNWTVKSNAPVALPDCAYTNLASSGWSGWVWNGQTNKTVVLQREAAFDGEVIVVPAAWEPVSGASKWVGLTNAKMEADGTAVGKWQESASGFRTATTCAKFITTGELAGRIATLKTTVYGPGCMTYWMKGDATSNSRMTVACGDETNVLAMTSSYSPRSVSVPDGLQTVSWNVEIVKKDDKSGAFYYLDDVTWTPSYTNRFAVTTGASPAEGGTTSGDGTYDVGTKVVLQAAARDGYAFVQWNDGATNPVHEVTVYGDITDYVAQFRAAPNAYYVVFDGNGASDALAMPVQTNVCGLSTALLRNRFSRPDWYFDHWLDVRTGETYADGAWVTDLADVGQSALLRAVWSLVPAPEPEPTPADRRDIADAAIVDGRLLMAFTNADARFDYRLHGTNDLVAPKPWPAIWTTNGTDTIVIEAPKTDSPQMFYYLQVIQKQ